MQTLMACTYFWIKHVGLGSMAARVRILTEFSRVTSVELLPTHLVFMDATRQKAIGRVLRIFYMLYILVFVGYVVC